MLLSLLAVSTYATAGNTPLATQPPAVQNQPDVQSPGNPAPEIRAGGSSYNYFELQALTGETPARKNGVAPQSDLDRERKDDLLPDGLSPSAVEGQPRKLDWTPVRRVAVRPNYPQTLYAAIDNLHGVWRSTNGGLFWEQLPFGVGSGRTIVFASPSVAIATFGYYDGADFVNGGVWRTGDGGNNWQNVGASIPNTVVSVAFDPTNSNRVYAATLGAGIYRGDYSAGSVTWTPINNGLSDTSIYGIAVSPSSPNVLYAGGFNWAYRSVDYGDNWVIADSLYPAYVTEAVAVSPSDPDTFYAGAQRLTTTGSPLSYGGFYKSVSGAGDGTLNLKNSGMQETFVLDIAQDPVNPNILYAGTWGSGFFRSDNGGDTWVEKNAYLDQPYIYGIEAIPDAGSPSGVTLYIAAFYTGASMYVSTDRGETWTVPYSYALPSMFDITTTTSPGDLAAATGYGVLYSTNGGVTWEISNDLTGGSSGLVLDLARDPNNGSKLLAATYGGGIWRSSNAGVSWTEASTGIGGSSYVYDLSFRPGSSTTAYAGSWGVYATTDGGSNWAPLGSLGQWIRDVDALGAPSYDLFAGTHDAGVYKSPTSNGTWAAINTGLGEYRIRSLKALASNQVFAGTNGRSAWEYNGASWTQKGPTIRAPGVIQIAIDPYTPSIIYAATDQGVYKSTNGGESWVPKNQGLGGYGDLVIGSIAIDPSNTSTIYLGTWGYGIFKSIDSGDHWTRLSDPLKCSKVYLPVVLKNYFGVAPPETVVLWEDFEGTFPGSWDVFDQDSTNGYYYWGKRNCRPYAGSYSGWAAGAGSSYLGCGSSYPTYMVSWMISPVFSMADADGGEMTFKMWLYSEYEYDGVCRMASTDGTNFSGYCATGNSSGWTDLVLDLSSYAGQPNVWVALIFVSDQTVTYSEGAYVDNIEVRKWVGTPDLSGAGVPEILPDTLQDEPASMTRP